MIDREPDAMPPRTRRWPHDGAGHPTRRTILLPLALGLLAALTAGQGPTASAQDPEPEGSRLHLPLLLSSLDRAALPTPITAPPPASATHTGPPTRIPSETPTPTASPSPSPPDCAALPGLDVKPLPTQELFVAPDGDDAAGDGTRDRPFQSIARAARVARPGTAIRLAPGTYTGGHYVENLRGLPGAEIWLGGIPGQARPVLEGSGTGLHLVRPRHLVLHDLEVRGASQNGINIDDGGDYADPEAAGDLVLRDLAIHDIGAGGNQDCLKLSGLYHVLVADSSFARCGGGGSGIDMVGVHHTRIARNHFQSMGSNAVQAKGGSRDIAIFWNRIQNGGQRAINLGGSTGFDYFRPPLAAAGENAEAREIIVLANLIEGSDTPWAFVGCDVCLAAHNTVIEPQRWLMRILQETTSRDGYRFAPARRGSVINNLFVFRRSQLRSDVNVGGGTAPETFDFRNNLFYALDDPPRSAPRLPGTVQGNLTGLDPQLLPDRSIPPTSPAAGGGFPGPWVSSQGDLTGRCFGDPPSIGAFEVDDALRR